MTSGPDNIHQNSEERIERLRRDYLRLNKFSISWPLIGRVVAFVIVVTIVTSAIFALANKTLTSLFGAGNWEVIKNFLQAFVAVASMLLVIRWDDQRRFGAFLARYDEEAEQVGGGDAEQLSD